MSIDKDYPNAVEVSCRKSKYRKANKYEQRRFKWVKDMIRRVVYNKAYFNSKVCNYNFRVKAPVFSTWRYAKEQRYTDNWAGGERFYYGGLSGKKKIKGKVTKFVEYSPDQSRGKDHILVHELMHYMNDSGKNGRKITYEGLNEMTAHMAAYIFDMEKEMRKLKRRIKELEWEARV